MTLLSLNTAVLSEIVSYIEPTELFRFVQCSRELSQLINQSDLIWHAIYRSWYGVPASPKPTHQSWKQAFIAQYIDFPSQYLPHYRPITQLWDRLYNQLSTKLPGFIASIKPGVSQDKWNQLSIPERCASISGRRKIPYDWLMFSRLVGGQELINPDDRSTYFTGMLGGFEVYDILVNDRLVPFEYTIGYLFEEGRHSFPVTCNILTANSANFAYYLDDQCRVVRRMGQRLQHHIVAPSFTSFLDDYVTKLEQDQFQISSQQGICRSLRDDPMGSVAVTEGIRVRVSVLYIPEMSIHGTKHTYTYRIQIDHDNTTSVKAKLTTRLWKIIDATGHEEEVEGPGVIGMYPVIYPGCDVFEYSSISSVTTTTGSMHGWLRFRVDGSDRIINVRVAPFHFDPSRNSV